MKGIVFNLLQEAVEAEFSEEAWDSLIDASGVSGAYTSLGSYPDEELFALVAAAAALLEKDQADILRWFGRNAMPMLQSRYPQFFASHRGARSFILSVNDIIHPEVRKLYAGASCPHFHFDEDRAGRLLLGYRSPRQLCQLAHGFIEGSLNHFGERATIEHVLCMHKGDGICRMSIDWQS
ncbi:heme NO-binding protein [Aurantiacibacter xanthus]|uniref:Heme NO-binding protein n=1 Tax=Aurantiacibacter xanthus TaxID=1784712 RepID=A0A3A1P945_9SPHN|nr:heme NO-binding domain-containing protein [Aurantiacibacter xanthus]RIV90213.1 heme NO-binding protein [Aurantiacibacter xanthus]